MNPPTWNPTRRDRLAYRLAGWALRIATPEYQAFIAVTSGLGIAELDRLILNTTETVADVLGYGAPKDTP